MAVELEAGQWLVAAGPVAAEAADARLVLSGYSILAGPHTPLVRLRSADGIIVGCVLGEALDLSAGDFLHGDGTTAAHTLPWTAAQLEPAVLEAWLYDLGGEWTAVIIGAGVRRLYQSQCRSSVYDAKARRAAAAPASLMPRAEYWSRFNQQLFIDRDMQHMGWLPAGLTCHRGVSRLLPNHALDLDTWKPLRHWAGPLPSLDPASTVRTMRETMTATLAAIARRKTLNLAFTAGHDSRAVLAACRPFQGTGQLKAFTIGIGDGSPDTVVPAEICAEIGLPHTFVHERRASADEQQRWLLRAGHCVGDANLHMHPTVWRFGPGDAVITGAAGEVGRARQWISSDTPATRLTAHGIIARLEVEPSPEMVERVDQWLAELSARPGIDALRILDLAHLEHRVGGWAAPQTLGNPLGPFHCGPLEHRAVIAGMLSLPADWRRHSTYVDRLIADGWPELARWPYNRFAGARHYAWLGSRLFSLGRIRRKLRLHLVSRWAN